MINKVNTICVIPARGGSKRIPNKNIIDFFGKPLVAWTIEAALKSGIFDRVILSTDSLEIAKVGETFGVEVPFLRAGFSDDYSSSSLATISAIKQASEYFNESYEVVAQLMPNCPIRNEFDISNHYNYFFNKQSDFQISYFEFGWMNPWWAIKKDSDKKHTWLFPDIMNQRSQDLPQLFCPTGAIWIAKVEKLFEEQTFYGSGHSYCNLSWQSAVDIDTYEDLNFAKAIFQMNNHV